jgi:nucleoside-diphosphate-sugar epimerase
MVKEEVEALTGNKVRIETLDKEDFRNYKVSCQWAKNVLGFLPRYGVLEIIRSLHEHHDEYGDFSNEAFYNIQVFKKTLLKRVVLGDGL